MTTPESLAPHSTGAISQVIQPSSFFLHRRLDRAVSTLWSSSSELYRIRTPDATITIGDERAAIALHAIAGNEPKRTTAAGRPRRHLHRSASSCNDLSLPAHASIYGLGTSPGRDHKRGDTFEGHVGLESGRAWRRKKTKGNRSQMRSFVRPEHLCSQAKSHRSYLLLFGPVF